METTFRFPAKPKPVRRRSAIGYCRVSTGRQAHVGHSLEVQKERIQRWCEANDYENLLIFEEHKSGKNACGRPVLLNCIELAKRDSLTLVTYSISRLARSVRDAASIFDDLKQSDANFASVTESIDTSSPTGKAFFHIMSVMAELERDMISERTQHAIDALRERGKRYSRQPPIGWQAVRKSRGGKLHPNVHEVHCCRLIWALHDRGWDYGEIYREMNARKLRARFNKPWNYARVGHIIRNREEFEEFIPAVDYPDNDKYLPCEPPETEIESAVEAMEMWIQHEDMISGPELQSELEHAATK